ncbi:outer membrane efflux protein [Phenylobacterium zucineum HLK1]|uniref:Outer membrane efflux protein n=1 Tax=Phenylobacterium zucineum (strain HLK1) TaxID=450851 RepID=B4R9V5_PHEZH|nr:TolC family protein [Phenylobacterium zucineum]ACG77869.1 outer membrane efflux protein [Phenylobacterium zucineum HLK1]
MRCLFPLPLILLALGGPAHAGPLTFEQALARARSTAPPIRSATLRTEAARSAAGAAGRLPDPQLKLGVENYPVSGPMAGRFGADEMTMATIGLMQEIPNQARRRAEVAGARADAAEAEAQAGVSDREVRVGAALAWLDLHYAERRLAALDEVLRQLQPLWDAAPSALASGASRPAMALTPVRLRAGLEDRRGELAAAAARARAELTRWTGDPAPVVSGPPPDAAPDPVRLRTALDAHPALQVFGAAGAKARAEVELARAAKRPDWAVEVGYGRRDPMFGDMVSAAVTVRLPLFPTRRQDPLIAARRAEAARVGVGREAARRQLAAELEGDLAEHEMRQAQWARARDVVQPAAQQQADLETASYAAGRAGLTDVLQAFTELAEVRLTVIEREAAAVRAAVQINLGYGEAP